MAILTPTIELNIECLWSDCQGQKKGYEVVRDLWPNVERFFAGFADLKRTKPRWNILIRAAAGELHSLLYTSVRQPLTQDQTPNVSRRL